MVETGVRDPSVESWPDGTVRLLAWRTPTICWLVMPGGGQLGRVEGDGDALLEAAGQVGPGDAVDAPRSRGRSPSGRSRATSSSPPLPVAAIDAMTTGEALMLRAWTVGVADGRQVRLGDGSWIAAVVSLTSVPNENWATTSEIEFDDVDCMTSSRGTPADGVLDRLGDLLGHVGRAGARVRRDDGDDREVDVRQELLLEAAPGRDAGDEQGAGEQERHAPLAEGEAAETTHEASPGAWWLAGRWIAASMAARSMAAVEG